MPPGKLHKLSPRVESQFVGDIIHVHLHRVRRDVQSLSDYMVIESCAHLS